MPEFDELVGLHRDGKSCGEILTAMKERDLTITEAIKASMHLFGVGLGDAKSLVSSHPSWNQTAEAAKPFQDALIYAFQEVDRSSAERVCPVLGGRPPIPTHRGRSGWR